MKKIKIKENLSMKVADVLRRKILEGTIKDKQHLVEATIAERLEISSGPVRDAIKILENEGFVFTPANGRTIAKGFTEKDIEDYHNLRYYLECEAVKDIISLSDKNEDYYIWLNELNEYINNMRKYLELNYDEIVNNYDYAFHDSIIKKSNNRFINGVWQSLKGTRKSIMEINEKYLSDYDIFSPKNFFHFHEGIYEGIKNNDLDKASFYFREHLDMGTKVYNMVIKQVNKLIV